MGRVIMVVVMLLAALAMTARGWTTRNIPSGLRLTLSPTDMHDLSGGLDYGRYWISHQERLQFTDGGGDSLRLKWGGFIFVRSYSQNADGKRWKYEAAHVPFWLPAVFLLIYAGFFCIRAVRAYRAREPRLPPPPPRSGAFG